MSLIKNINEMANTRNLSPDMQDIVTRVAEYWRSQAGAMSDDELRNAIGMDLENVPDVEGNPELISMLIPIILSKVHGG